MRINGSEFRRVKFGGKTKPNDIGGKNNGDPPFRFKPYISFFDSYYITKWDHVDVWLK